MVLFLVSFCAYQSSYSTDSSTVTYDEITFQHNFKKNGGMNKTTGQFISSTKGVFSVSFFFSADNIKGDKLTTAIETKLNIRKNDINLKEGDIYSTVFSSKSSFDDDSSGKSLLLYMEKEDVLSVFMNTGSIHYVTFCIHSIG